MAVENEGPGQEKARLSHLVCPSKNTEAFCRKSPFESSTDDPLFELLTPYRAIQRTVGAGRCLLLPKYPALKTVAAARAWICPREGPELVNFHDRSP